MGDTAGEPADRFHLLRLPQLALDARDVGHVVERHGDSVVVQPEGFDREDAGPDPIVGVLDLPGVEHLARLDDPQQAVDQRLRNVREDLPERAPHDLCDREPGCVLGCLVGETQPQRSVTSGEHVEGGLHVLDDLVLQLQLFEERTALLQFVRISQHRADELRHQPRRLDGELVERVRFSAENGQDSDDRAVAVEWRADQRSDAEARAHVAVGSRVDRCVRRIDRRVVQRREPGETRRAVEP